VKEFLNKKIPKDSRNKLGSINSRWSRTKNNTIS